jgi:hypothetical protein
MAEAPKLETCDRVLVVEGYSDLRFYAELLEVLGRHSGVFIKQFNGRSDLSTKLETFVTPQLLTTKQALGVIVDADSDPQGTSASLAALLSRLTGQTVAPGIWTAGKPRVGFFLTPDGNSSGEVETLVWRAWAGDPANAQPRRCVEEFVACMSKAGFAAHSPDKGVVSALLAIRNDDDPRLGPGAQAKVFDFARPEFAPLKRFLSEL